MDEVRNDDAGKRVGQTQGVARTTEGIAAGIFAHAGFADPRLVTHWVDIVGAEAAALCLPLRLKGGVLTLKAESGASVFLSYETREMAQRINAYLGRPAVSRIKLVPGTLTPARPAPQPHRIAAETVAKGDPVETFSGPDGLRAALVRLARARRGRIIMR